MATPDPPTRLSWGFRAAQGLFLCLFLARDARGASPGKRLVGLEVVRDGEAPASLAASLVRNVPLLVPGWNLIEAWEVVRRSDGRRPGDRLAGTRVRET